MVIVLKEILVFADQVGQVNCVQLQSAVKAVLMVHAQHLIHVHVRKDGLVPGVIRLDVILDAFMVNA